jgi:hypothetical protein
VGLVDLPAGQRHRRGGQLRRQRLPVQRRREHAPRDRHHPAGLGLQTPQQISDRRRRADTALGEVTLPIQPGHGRHHVVLQGADRCFQKEHLVD